MGASTKYHPVSLHVIRGAAEYCGWKFGKITQLSGDQERNTARYRAEIEVIPVESQNQTTMIMSNDLDNCFAADIHVHWLRQTQNGTWMCDLAVDANPDHHVDVTRIVEKQESGE